MKNDAGSHPHIQKRIPYCWNTSSQVVELYCFPSVRFIHGHGIYTEACTFKREPCEFGSIGGVASACKHYRVSSANPHSEGVKSSSTKLYRWIDGIQKSQTLGSKEHCFSNFAVGGPILLTGQGRYCWAWKGHFRFLWSGNNFHLNIQDVFRNHTRAGSPQCWWWNPKI